MKQHGLTVVTNVQKGQEDTLRQALVGFESRFKRMPTLHFGAFLILDRVDQTPPRLVLETNYDGPEKEHLYELIEVGGDQLITIYQCCEEFQPNPRPIDSATFANLLRSKSHPSSAFFVAFPGRSVADIRNAIDVHNEATRFLDSRRRAGGINGRNGDDVFAELVEHFRSHSSVGPHASEWSRPWLKLWVLFMSVWLLPLALVLVPIFAAFCLIARLYEWRETAAKPRRDPPRHDQRFELMNRGKPQNHLCTYAEVTRKRFRWLAVRYSLFLTALGARFFYVFGKLGSIASIHFARWTLTDDGKRILFLSNYDGSWSSYLSDFSDQGFGINAIWSHTIAFTPTRYMVLGGAYNIVPYEEGVATHFHNALVFYNAYPGYSVANISRYLDFRDELADSIEQANRLRGRLQGRWLKARRGDIQGIVASGYIHLTHARFTFLNVFDAPSALRWLENALPFVTCAEHPGDNPAPRCLNIAFTYKGLEAIVGPDGLVDFPYEFVAGMNRREAAIVLGDTGESAQEHWLYGGSTGQPIHVLLMLYAASYNDLEAFAAELFEIGGFAAGMRAVASQDTSRAIGDFNEPFGFRDGISQPDVVGLGGRSDTQGDPIKTGEFLCGYENELGLLASVPGVHRGRGVDELLPDHPERAGVGAFGQNGTYLVFRRLAQDVRAFNDFVRNQPGLRGDKIDPELFAAKLMGRWRSGAPLIQAPDGDAPHLADRNDFVYATDPHGLICPIGSHIRRANPRDSLPFPAAQSLTFSRHHRLLRRGRKFGPHDRSSVDSQPRDGICFIAINADLRRQFEFVQQNWIENPTFNGLDKDKDPIAGSNSGDGQFTIQSNPANRRVTGIQRFVTMQGGGYFFLPGVRALRYLASLRPPPARQ